LQKTEKKSVIVWIAQLKQRMIWHPTSQKCSYGIVQYNKHLRDPGKWPEVEK
jgi:hypothetical protein